MEVDYNSTSSDDETFDKYLKNVSEVVVDVEAAPSTSSGLSDEPVIVSSQGARRPKRKCVQKKINKEKSAAKKPKRKVRTPKSYEKLKPAALESLATRIQTVIETGFVPSDTEDVKQCANKYKKKKKTTNAARGEQVPGTTFGQGAIGTTLIGFGVKKCACCNASSCTKRLENLPSTSIGVSKFEERFRRMSSRMQEIIRDNENRSIHEQRRQLLVHPEMNFLTQDTLTPQKRAWVQRFIDTMLVDRIDYEPIEKLNIVQGINPSIFTRYSNPVRQSTPKRNVIIERVNYEKPGLPAATSTPIMKDTIINTVLSDDGLSNDTIIYSPPKENSTLVKLSQDFSDVDSSFVTLRTPHKSSTRVELDTPTAGPSCAFTSYVPLESSIPRFKKDVPKPSENELMSFVDNLLGDDAEVIEQQITERYERTLGPSLSEANAAMASIINLADIIDDDGFNDHSVIVIDDTTTNGSVEIIENSPFKSQGRLASALTGKDDEVVDVDAEPQPRSGSRDCPICFESLSGKSTSATTCGHIFCTPCITQAIKLTRKCPNCRKGLTMKKIHPLFL